MVTGTYPVLGDSLVGVGSDSKIDDNFEGRAKDDSCFAQVCLWMKKDVKMEDTPEV